MEQHPAVGVEAFAVRDGQCVLAFISHLIITSPKEKRLSSPDGL